MLKVGIAGIGFMGVTHFNAWREVEGAEVVAICTRSKEKLAGDWSAIQGNFGGAGGQVDVSGLARYRDLEKLLADDSLDVIDICLPTPLHREAGEAALAAGRHVVLEKPIALEVADADALVEAADRAGRLLFVAQVLRFWPEWRALKRIVADETYGELLALHLERVISSPDWSRDVADLAASGGPMIDLHIHDVDFILYLLGRPARVSAAGIDDGSFVRYAATHYAYPEGPTVSSRSGAVSVSGRPFMQSFEAHFERATVAFRSATEPGELEPGQRAAQGLTVYDAEGNGAPLEAPGPDGFVGQLAHVAECVAAGEPSDVIGPRSARDALALVHREIESIRSGGPVGG